VRISVAQETVTYSEAAEKYVVDLIASIPALNKRADFYYVYYVPTLISSPLPH
jgi:hypothetical protein